MEAFFMQFGGRAHVLGFSQTERLLPVGFPMMAYQPIFRFRKSDAATSLYQVGAGVFTANAVPPYSSWENFSVDISKGIEALLSTRPPTEKNSNFTSVSLRYIDAFNDELTGGRDVVRFLAEIFNLTISLPKSISGNIAAGATFKPTLQLHLPMENGVVMNIVVGEGSGPTGNAIVMDTTVVTTTPTAGTLEAAMTALKSAHDVIHNMFFELIKPIEDLIGHKEN